jgi:tetratricopeptide (TPR) repeat protein
VAIRAGQAQAQAQAQGTAAAREEARKHFNKGTQLYNVQLYEDAVKEFREAYLKYPSPVFLFNIGQALRLAGQREQAIVAYERYLAESPRARDRAEVEAIIKQLKEELQQLPIISVPPWGPARLEQQQQQQQGRGQQQPQGAAQQPQGAAQQPQGAAQQPQGAAQQPQEAAQQPQEAAQQAPPPAVVPPPVVVSKPPRPPRQPLSPRVRLGIGLTAGGVAAAGVGAGMFGWLRSSVTAYDRAYNGCFIGPSPQLPCSDPALGTLGRINTLNVVAPVLVGVGGAMVTAGAVLWGLHRKEKPKVSVVPTLLPGGAAIGFVGVLP